MNHFKPSDAQFFTDQILRKCSDDAEQNLQEEVPVHQHKPLRKVEVLCDAYFYDVTEFIKRHPGGYIHN